MTLFDRQVTLDLVLYCLPVVELVMVPVRLIHLQYGQNGLVQRVLTALLGLPGLRGVVKGLFGGFDLGRRALTNISRRFFGLLCPLTILRFVRGLVELDLSSRSQFFVTIVSHSLKNGWKVVIKKLLLLS